METDKAPTRKDGRVIIHFDYDSFYASVFEAANPVLRGLPLAVRQKQIIVTCNYEARRRGLHKLQLVREARRACPDLIIVMGEDISPFRDASKALFRFLRSFSWNGRVERLGFDEVWMDVTDLVEWNFDAVDWSGGRASFFGIVRDDPTVGFEFDASSVAGGTVPKVGVDGGGGAALGLVEEDEIALRLRLAGHLALYMRHQLEEKMGYSSTVGVATNKLLAKLVGNVNKPKAQTTLMPSSRTASVGMSASAIAFLDNHEIGKIPGIGFKLAQKLRGFVLGRPADFDRGLVYGGTLESVTVAAVRNHPDVNPEMLEKLLGGPGSPRGIGLKIWCLLHGVDDTEVGQARPVPRQISIEDSYIRLDTMPEVLRELNMLARSLITRMRIDLLGSEDDFDDDNDDDDDDEKNEDADAKPIAQPKCPADDPSPTGKKWLAHPKTLRLTTRPRQPLQPDGTRVRSFKRISHSAPLPNFVFTLHEPVDALAERLVRDSLVPMFRKLHPDKAGGWNLSLVNLAVTNMAEAAGETKTANGRDIGSMFRRQEDVLRDFRVTESDDADESPPRVADAIGEEPGTGESGDGGWDGDASARGDESVHHEQSGMEFCHVCGSHVPAFAMLAHRRFHSPGIE